MNERQYDKKSTTGALWRGGAMRHEKGFTLLEVMLTVVVLAILVALAVPSFHNLILRSRLNAAVEDISVVIHLARSEAIMRSHEVRLTPVDADDWGRGLQVLVDDELEGDFTDARLLFLSQAIHSSVEVGEAVGHNAADYVAFGSLGYLSNPNSVVALNIKTSGCSYALMMNLRLAPSGEVLVTEEECS